MPVYPIHDWPFCSQRHKNIYIIIEIYMYIHIYICLYRGYTVFRKFQFDDFPISIFGYVRRLSQLLAIRITCGWAGLELFTASLPKGGDYSCGYIKRHRICIYHHDIFTIILTYVIDYSHKYVYTYIYIYIHIYIHIYIYIYTHININYISTCICTCTCTCTCT